MCKIKLNPQTWSNVWIYKNIDFWAVLYIKSEYSENRRCRLRAHLFHALLAKRILTLRYSCKSGPTYHGDFSSGIHRGVTDGFILIS